MCGLQLNFLRADLEQSEFEMFDSEDKTPESTLILVMQDMFKRAADAAARGDYSAAAAGRFLED